MEDPETIRAFLNKWGYSFRSLVDPDKKVTNLFDVGPIPTTVLIDKNGKIVRQDIGGDSYEKMRESLNALGF